MTNASTTRMSSKGQVVIPEEVRSRMGLESGEQFVVVGEGDVVVLQRISAPSIREFDELISSARKQARLSGMKRGDVADAVRDVRKKR